MQPERYQMPPKSGLQKLPVQTTVSYERPQPVIPANKNESTGIIEPEWWIKPKKREVSLTNLLKTLCEVNLENGKAYLTSESSSNKHTRDVIQYPSISKYQPGQEQNISFSDNGISPSLKISSTHQVSLSYTDPLEENNQ